MLCDYHTHSKTLLVHSSEYLSLSIPHGFAPCHCVSLVSSPKQPARRILAGGHQHGKLMFRRRTKGGHLAWSPPHGSFKIQRFQEMSTGSLCVCAASIALAITFMCVIMCSDLLSTQNEGCTNKMLPQS